MNNIAFCFGSVVIYWSSIVICFGLAACLFMSLALQRSCGERLSGMLLFMPLMTVYSIVLCRLLHWYCHIEQYPSLLSALTDYSSGGFVITAAIPAAYLAAYTVHSFGLCKSPGRLLDAFAPGAALAIGFIKLSALFSSSCRSKIMVQLPALQTLPFASAVRNFAGETEYRFATFFVHFLIMLLISALLLFFFARHRNDRMKSGSRYGHTMSLFLLLYSASEVVMDSTRNDASYLPFNGFVSVVQTLSGLILLALLIYYSVHTIKARGLRLSHFISWLGFLLGFALVGGSEYLVQRHGDWYMGCYPVMTVGILLMAYIVYLQCKSIRIERHDPI